VVGAVLSLSFLWQGSQSVLLGGGDTGWLIRTGEYIASNVHLPGHDLYTWTCSGRPFVCYQWLFELFLFGLYKIGGLSAVGAVSFVVVSVLYLYCLPKTWLALGVRPAVIPVFMALLLTPFWFFARPQLASFVLAFAFIQILEVWRKSPRSRLIYLLPPLTAVWTNLHCVAGLGVALMVVYFFDATLVKQKESKCTGQLLAMLLLALAALFATPLDLPTLAASAQTFTHTDLASCNELKPLFVTSYLWHLSNLYVLAALIILTAGRRKLPRCGLFIALAALVSGLVVARLQPLGVLLSWPFVGMALADCQAVVTSTRLKIAWLIGALAVALAIWFIRYPQEETAVNAFLGSQPALQLAAKKSQARRSPL
jgi:hypothetical protein